ETLHTISYAEKSAQSRLISEVVPAQQLVRIYSIDKGIKNKFIFSFQTYNDEEVELRLLDYNWDNNTAKVLMSLFVRNGARVAKYIVPTKTMGLSANVMNTSDESMFACTKPNPSSNAAAALDEQTPYFQ